MKIVAVIAVTLTALVVVVIVVGAMLPRKHTVSRSLVLNRAPEEVYLVLRDVGVSPQWRPGVQRVELLGPVNGRARFRESSKDGSVTYEILEEHPGRELVTRIVDENLGYSGSWTYTLAPENDQTRLTITEQGDVSNIFFRFMSHFVFGQTATIDRALAGLGQHFRSPAPSAKG